jgi:hypothetical protein
MTDTECLYRVTACSQFSKNNRRSFGSSLRRLAQDDIAKVGVVRIRREPHAISGPLDSQLALAHVAPHLLRGQLACLEAAQRLNLVCTPSFNPLSGWTAYQAFDARISSISTCGALASSSSALAKSALAISPERCACLPASSLNVS